MAYLHSAVIIIPNDTPPFASEKSPKMRGCRSYKRAFEKCQAYHFATNVRHRDNGLGYFPMSPPPSTHTHQSGVFEPPPLDRRDILPSCTHFVWNVNGRAKWCPYHSHRILPRSDGVLRSVLFSRAVLLTHRFAPLPATAAV